MHEKLRAAAAALRDAAEDCHQRFMSYRDLADRLDQVAGANLQPADAAPSAKQCKPRGGRLTVKVAIDGKKLSDAVTLKPVQAEPAIERTPSGKIAKGSLDAPFIRHITAHPGMRCPELARVFGTTADNLSHLLKRLLREKRIVREGGGFHPVTQDTTVN
jgi:hypothetical protein